MNERWTATATDPNRSFGPMSELRTDESSMLMKFLRELGVKDDKTCYMTKWLCHIDLHETTDSDVTEFRPAKTSRDGLTEYDNHVPDGFYLVGDSCDIHGNELTDNKDQLDFYNYILKRVEGITHVAETEPGGTLSGYPATSRGLILVPAKKYGICSGGAVPSAPFVATTEVYPDSDRVTDEDCINAQVECICAELSFEEGCDFDTLRSTCS